MSGLMVSKGPGFWVASVAALGLAASVEAANKARVSLVPSVEVIVAGQEFDMGLRFEQDPGWHIYWQNSGDSGLPPTVHWIVPDGLTVSELRFPVPKRHVSPGDIITNILPGEPILLVDVKSAATLPEQKARLQGKVRYLVCNETCIQETADVEVTIPVSHGGDPVKMNQDVLAKARRNLPKTDSKYVSIKTKTTPETPTAGSKFELLVDVEIAKGHHLQSNKPTLPTLIPAELFVERREGVRFQRAVYPEGKTRPDKYLGSLSEYDEAIAIRVPGEIDGDRPAGPMRVGGVFSFQACDEQGHCFPPEAVSFSLVGGTIASGAAVQPGTTAGTLGSAPSESANASIEAFLKQFGLWGLFVGCFLYGLFINATPCVLPLLSIKVLGFVKQAHQSRGRTLALGLSFGAGVMVFFVLLGLLAAAGTNILQFPEAVIGLGIVVMAMGLSMLGVFTLQPPTAALNLDANLTQEGPLTSFGKGALAPILGFACTGPLLAGAFGWATQQPKPIAVLAFLFMGLGMALPYMLLGAKPNWLSFLPKPGEWMVTFERIMGFLLLAMVIWLLHPLVTQIGTEGLEWTLVFLVFVGLACWILGQVRYDMTPTRRWGLRGSALGLVLVVGGVIYEGIFPLHEAVAAAKAYREALAHCESNDFPDKVHFRPWSAQAVEDAARGGKLVFVDFTAAFCTVCKVNKAVAINTREVVEKLTALDALAFQGDFSSKDENISDVLKRYKGGAILPLNLIYPPGKPDSPLVLEPNLTKAYLLQKLDEAAALGSATAMTTSP